MSKTLQQARNEAAIQAELALMESAKGQKQYAALVDARDKAQVKVNEWNERKMQLRHLMNVILEARKPQ